jgi:hypothetical protein
MRLRLNHGAFPLDGSGRLSYRAGQTKRLFCSAKGLTMFQLANGKVIGILAALTAAAVLVPNWPSWAQQSADPVPYYGQSGAKKEKPQDTQPDLRRTAEELAKLKQYLDMLKADYDSKAAQLLDAQTAVQQKPATIEQRLSEIERKLDLIIATLGKKGPTAFAPTMVPPNPLVTPVPPTGKFAPAQPPYAPTQPRQPTPEGSGFAPVFPAPEPAKQ